MLYRIPQNHSTTETVAPPVITGKTLAPTKMTPTQAGAVAALIALGEITLKPTWEQACQAAGANKQYARKAALLPPAERKKLADGYGGLRYEYEEAASASLLKPKAFLTLLEVMVAGWHELTADERATFGAIVGVSALWDQAIVPNLNP
jgi:hypothetical protein